MGSRIRENPERLFECFLEVVAPTVEIPDPWIIQQFPDRFKEQDVLKTVGQFAYPCKIYCSTVQHFSFVLTNIDSKWTYGFCRHAPNSSTCFCILSCLPWHETFFKLLDRIAEITHRHEDCELSNFLESAYNSTVPQPGSKVRISYNEGRRYLDLNCPDHRKLPSLTENRNLSEYYSAIDVNNMILIFASMLNERRILITSSRLSRVSACIQAASALLYPMHWQHIFIPVLPLQLSDYLSAPMPFLIGVPMPVFENLRRSELSDAVIVNADANHVATPFDDLQNLPLDILTTLRRRLKNPDSVKGDGIARAFLFALVQLIGGYRDALKFVDGESITFCREAFLQSRHNSMQPYLEKMLHLQIFQQFVEDRLEMLNSGKGLNDIFEEEVSFYADKGGAKFKMQYKEWMGNFKKEGGALLRSMKSKTNPAVKHAYKHVRDKSKKAYKEVRSIFHDNQGKDDKYSSSFSETLEQPRSAPASPTLVRPTTVHGTKLTRSTSNQRSIVSYVRPRDGPTRRTANGRIETVKKSVQYSPLKVGQSPTDNGSVEEAINGSLDADLDVPRVPLDLMNDLKDVIFTKLTLSERMNSTNEISSTDGLSPLDKNAPPIYRSLKPPLSPEIGTVSNSNVSHILSPPLPPPRTKRQCTPYVKDSSGTSLQTPRNEEVPLIRLDSEESDVVFDPLLAKESDGGSVVGESSTKQQSSLDAFQGPQNRFFSTSSSPPPTPPHNPLKGMVIPPTSPSMALNNPVYFHVIPATYHQSVVPHSPNSTVINGNALLHFTGAVLHSNNSPQSSPPISSSGMGYSSAGTRSRTLPSHSIVSPSGTFSSSTMGSTTDRLNSSSSSGLASPKTLINNNYPPADVLPVRPLSTSPQPSTVGLTLSQQLGSFLTSSNRLSSGSSEDQHVSYLHGSYRRETLPSNLVSQRTKMFENFLYLDSNSSSSSSNSKQDSVYSDSGIHSPTTVSDQRKQWQTFE